jgi:hypothetical protein
MGKRKMLTYILYLFFLPKAMGLPDNMKSSSLDGRKNLARFCSFSFVCLKLARH